MISKGFLKSSIVYTIGGAMPMVASVLLLPFYANYLNEKHFLQISFYISIALLFQIVFSFSLDTFFGIKYTQLNSDPEKQKRFLGTTSFLLIILGVFWLAIMALVGEKVISVVFRPDFQIEFWPWGFYSILTAFFNSYFKTCTNSLIYLKKPLLFLGLNFLNVIVTLAISISGLFIYPETIIGPMYGRLLSGVVIFIAAHIVFIKFGVFKFEREFLPEIKQFCIPFLFFGLSAWVLSQIDRYMLQSYITEKDLNTYDLVLKCFFGVEFVQNSLSAIIFPKVYEIWSKQDKLHTTKESNRYFNVFTAVNIVQLILFCIAIPLLYQLFITKRSFHEASSYIGLLAAGFGLRSIINFYISTIFYTRSTTKLLLIFGLSAIFQIVATYYASINLGLLGVIYAGILTKIVQAILSAIITRGIFNYEFNYFKIYVVPLLFLLVNMVQFYFYPAYDARLYFLQLLIFAILFFFLFRKEIKQVLVQFKIMNA